ncbi:MAG: HigA family addiction module antidote protein [Caulobacteraceae bacterium]|nr:HigA family addiction module antidote protein [Caulobacter sp.]
MSKRVLPPVHPGEILREEFLGPLGLTPYALAKSMEVPRTRVERLAREETAVTPDTALRLGRALGTSAELWINMQARFDLATAQDLADEAELARIPNLNPGREAA